MWKSRKIESIHTTRYVCAGVGILMTPCLLGVIYLDEADANAAVVSGQNSGEGARRQ